MIGMDDFFTRQKANDGVKLPLSLPDGSPTDHWLTVRGVDSDIFRDAETEAKRNAMRVASMEDESERKEALADEKRTLVASLIVGWSFDEECTLENIKNFLREAPQVADQIDQIAARRSLFFAERLSSSQSTPKPSSSSAKPRKGQK